MLRITGYSDKYQAFPGEEIKFYVNAEKNENYDVQIIRLIHGAVSYTHLTLPTTPYV